ncbi:MAG: ATPase family associated with various cellular activities (AAA) [uncultured Sulfurovum sp.]|uniref:ATPase family associated with various cellular activities (AAA) n=1 Tax=uncultured Sulfurovum sp. TaxID=269237 RepID=A0A6S6TLD2_9BACT|nr:MAG: ATPase family associated with various cellular activities (AAA) [uncultured Sulfurovum sp.]
MEEANLYKLTKETLEKKSNLLVGNKTIRKELENIINTSIDEKKKEFDFLDINGNILIYGQPGFGKTSIIYEQMLKAKNNKYETYHLNIASLISEKMGKTAKAIDSFFKNLIEESKKYKIILLIEEIEVFLPNREGKDHDDMKRALTTFMHYMDNPINNLIIFCTTNHKDKLDKAILRRFSFIYEINSISTEMIMDFFNHDKNPFKNILEEKDKKELSILLDKKNISFSDIKLIMRKVYLKNNFTLNYKNFKEEIVNVN